MSFFQGIGQTRSTAFYLNFKRADGSFIEAPDANHWRLCGQAGERFPALTTPYEHAVSNFLLGRAGTSRVCFRRSGLWFERQTTTKGGGKAWTLWEKLHIVLPRELIVAATQYSSAKCGCSNVISVGELALYRAEYSVDTPEHEDEALRIMRRDEFDAIVLSYKV